MRPLVLHLVRTPPAVAAVVREAAKLAFARVELIETGSVVEAAHRPAAAGPELVVLTNPDVAEAAEAADVEESSRWAVVILGEDPAEDVCAIPAADWQPRLLAHAFLAALREHELVQENTRLRGDLRTMARRISHDLRTPVNCVHTTCELLGELTIGPANGALSAVHVIRDSAVEISQIVERTSLLLKATTDPALPGAVAMGPAVAAALRSLEARLESGGAVVEQPASWPEIEGVAKWLEVVWRELLANALVHGGSPPRIQAGWQREATGVCTFWVADRGPGVPPERAGRLFSSFDQLHSRSSSCGLGLPLVERLVSLQGGRFGWANRPEGGARFWFTLPAAEEARSDQ